MNKKVNLFLTSLVAAFIVILSSCGGSGESTGESSSSESKSDSPIVGDWTIVKAEGTAAEANKGLVYEFKSDGKAKVSYTDYTYALEGDTLKMDYEGAGQIILTWVCKIDGNKMKLDNATDAEQKLWLEKK